MVVYRMLTYHALLYIYGGIPSRHYSIQRKNDNLRNEQGDTYTNRKSERTLIYPWFLLHVLDLRVLLGNSLGKVSSILGKNHNHLKRAEGEYFTWAEKIKRYKGSGTAASPQRQRPLNATQLPIENGRQRPVNQRLTNSVYRAPQGHFLL